MLQDHLQSDEIFYQTCTTEKSDLTVVVRALPISSEVKDICKDPVAQGISVNSVHRMHSTRDTKRQIPLFLVKVNRGNDKIYKVTRCLYLILPVEKQRQRNMPGQCYRCQWYGHSLAHCLMKVRCVPCREEQRAAECDRKKEISAMCALCNKANPSNYKGCEYATKLKKATPVTKG